jgi:hypothetical protein
MIWKSHKSVLAVCLAVFLALALTFLDLPAAGARPGPHVYLLRGLLNVFSLGMDELGEKLNKRGIPATVTGYTGWETLADHIAAEYKAGRHGPIILIGHSFGADAVMNMGAYLTRKGVPVALIVPFDASGPIAAAPGVAHVLNLTQRAYAKMTRAPGFKGELVNIDLTKDANIGHLNVDKSPRLHAMVIRKIQSIIGSGGNAPAPQPTSHATHGKKPEAKAADPATTSSVSSAHKPGVPPDAAKSTVAAAPAASTVAAAPAAAPAKPEPDAVAPPPKLKPQLPD